PVEGTINVRNVSASASGTYRCVASNRVGSEECILHLQVTPPRNTAGIIAGSIIAVLLILILLAIILFCFCRSRKRKKYEKEICNEIRYANQTSINVARRCRLIRQWKYSNSVGI
ncbi:hypothetical protein GOODEAATRI_029026, partial [Goodea atripinnis]